MSPLIRKPKTAMIVYNFFPFDPRVRKEAEILQENGINIDVYCIGSSSEPRLDTYNGINIIRVQKIENLSTRVSFIKMLLFWLVTFRIIIKKDYKILHIHDLTAIPPGILYKIFRIRTRTIYDSHELFPENSRHIIGVVGMIYAYFLEFVSRPFINALVSVSGTLKSIIQRRYRYTTSFSVMNAPLERDINLLFNDKKENSAIRIIYAGTIQPYRGYLELLQAIKILKGKDLPPYKIIIAGDGPILQDLKEFSQKNGLDENITFTGLLKVDDYYREIAKSQIGLILFKGEYYQNLALPIKAFEYIFGNLNVICNKSLFPTGKQLIRKYLQLIEVDSQDPQSIAQGLIESIQNFQKLKITPQQPDKYRKSIEHLSFDKQMEKLVTYYKSFS